MSMVIINPGTGDVPDATEEHAIVAARQMVLDLAQPTYADDAPLHGVTFTRCDRKRDHGDGRFAFTFHYNGRSVVVEIPGLPLDRVRYVSRDQNIWHFPRLYVNGSSYVWLYAWSCINNALNPTEEA